MPRSLRIAVLIVSLLTLAYLLATVPDFGALIVEKVSEGGMWTALAVFIAVAIVLGARRAANPAARPGDGPRQ